MAKNITFTSTPLTGKLTSQASKEEEKKKQKPTASVGKKKGGDPVFRRNG